LKLRASTSTPSGQVALLNMQLNHEVHIEITEMPDGIPLYRYRDAEGREQLFTVELDVGVDAEAEAPNVCSRHTMRMVGQDLHSRARFDWLLRQFTVVRPYDQNHEPDKKWHPSCCSMNMERLGVCVHHLFDCLSDTLACVLTCGCSEVRSWEQVKPPKLGGGKGCCYCFWHSLDELTSRSLACIAIPTRIGGRCCGRMCRNLCTPVHEAFSGPPGPCSMDCITFEIGGGIGNAYTHIFKGSHMAFTRLRRRVVDAWCGCIHSYSCCHCLATSSKMMAAHACGSVLVNVAYFLSIGWEELLIMGPAIECFDVFFNSDLYLQGPVLLQGFLKVDPSTVFLGADSFPHAWVVVRPWAVSVYHSPKEVGPGTARIMLPTSMIFDITTIYETPGWIEIRTTDFTRIILQAPESGASLAETVGVELAEEYAHETWQHEDVDIEVWRSVLKRATKRVESVTAWDQGVSTIDTSIPFEVGLGYGELRESMESPGIVSDDAGLGERAFAQVDKIYKASRNMQRGAATMLHHDVLHEQDEKQAQKEALDDFDNALKASVSGLS